MARWNSDRVAMPCRIAAYSALIIGLSAFSGCGRTHTFAEDSGVVVDDMAVFDGPVDTTVDGRPGRDSRIDTIIPPPDFGTDMFIPPDFGPDTILPCQAGCNEICQTVSNQCGILPFQACLNQCANLSPDEFNCILKNYCESGPCNNYVQCIIPQQLPDLVVASFNASVAGNTVSYNIEVCNVGSGPAQGFFIDAYYDRNSAPGTGDFGEFFENIQSLGPGNCITRQHMRTGTPPGTYSSWAQVDADGIVNEQDETNNVDGPITVTVSGPPPKIDLTITTMTVSVVGAQADTLEYDMLVCNNGTDPAPAADVHLYHNLPAPPQPGTPGDQVFQIPPLGVGLCINQVLQRSSTPPGTYNAYAFVDPFDAVAEDIENNNIFGPVTATVAGDPDADLLISTFTAQVGPANSVAYQAIVCNVGTGNSEPTQVHVYFDRPTAPGVGQGGDEFLGVPPLGPNDCFTANLTRNNTPPGTYTSWAQVDPFDSFAEIKEDNNVAGPASVTITPAGMPDLVVDQITATVANQTVNYTIQVCNFGTADATSPIRVDLFYDQPFAPGPPQAGDQNQVLAPPLPVQACAQVFMSRNNTPFGSYQSWAYVDIVGQIAEIDENNNVAGPEIVIIDQPPLGCFFICITAVQCGIFPANQANQCQDWCNGFTTQQRQCMDAAGGNCQAMQACNPPPPPPPPPPPGACGDICTFLRDDCGLIPPDQYWTCIGACNNLAPNRIQCAIDAVNNNQCIQTATCIFL